MKPHIGAIYLAVKNMRRAVRFYEFAFKRKVTAYDKRMSIFAFDGISFLLFDPRAEGEKVTVGNNVIPNIEVANARAAFKLMKSRKMKVVMSLCQVNDFLLFQIRDPENNVVEFYQKLKAKARN